MPQQREQLTPFQTNEIISLLINKAFSPSAHLSSKHKRLQKSITILLGLASLLLSTVAFAASVTLEVNWPEYSGENSVQIYDATNTTPITPVFNDGVGGASNTPFSGTSPTYTLTDGETYTLRMIDSYGDGWTGSGAKVLVKVNGINVMGSPGPDVSPNPLPDSVTKTQQFVATAPSQPSISTTVCTGDALPGDAVNLSFADVGVDWPGSTYTPQTFTNINGGGVQATFSWSDTSTFTNSFETSTNTGNGDTGAFFLSGGFGGITTTLTIDLSANPAGFVDLCNYHINFSGGNGDKVTYRAITENGTTLTNPTFSPAASPDYIYPSPNSADAYTNSSLLNALLGVKFTAPSGDRITRVEIDWTDATGGAGVGFQHGLGIGEIAFNNPVATTVDYSDGPADGSAAPVSGTTSYGVATHTITSGVQLGATITNESSAVEDADNASDDGVTLPTLTQTQGQLINVAVAGASGFLQGWIDWNGNGAFDADEQIATDLQDDGTGADVTASDGTITFHVTAPYAAITSQTFARFRWSTTSGLDTTVKTRLFINFLIEQFRLFTIPFFHRLDRRQMT